MKEWVKLMKMNNIYWKTSPLQNYLLNKKFRSSESDNLVESEKFSESNEFDRPIELIKIAESRYACTSDVNAISDYSDCTNSSIEDCSTENDLATCEKIDVNDCKQPSNITYDYNCTQNCVCNDNNCYDNDNTCDAKENLDAVVCDENFSHLVGELVDIGEFSNSAQKVEIIQFHEANKFAKKSKIEQKKKYRMRYFKQDLC